MLLQVHLAVVAFQAEILDMLISLMLEQPFCVWTTIVANHAVAGGVRISLMLLEFYFGRIGLDCAAPAGVRVDEFVGFGFGAPAIVAD
jgi:hypothetical protein